MKTLITIILILTFHAVLSAQNYWQELLPPTVRPQSLDVSSTGNVFVIWDYLLLRSSDNGQSWDSLCVAYAGVNDFMTSPTGPIYLSLVDSLRKSTDEGNTWIAAVSPFYPPIMGLSIFTTNQLGYIFIQQPYFYWDTFRSTDEGNSWNLIGFDSSAISDIAFKDDLTFATFYGNDAGLYKSSDDGDTWELIPNASANLTTLFASKSGKLFAGIDGGNSSGNLFISSDDGETWSTLSEFNGNSIRDIEENQLGHIFVATLDGVYKSTDDGDSWQQINSGLNSNHIWCQKLSVDSAGFIYVTSGTAQMLYRSVESTTSVEEENLVVNTFILEQNYPNPFNPTTTIGFGVQEKSNVKITILNAIGEEVAIVLNEEIEAGYHTVEFRADNMPSGVYFYQLKSGNFIETKKMLLLK